MHAHKCHPPPSIHQQPHQQQSIDTYFQASVTSPNSTTHEQSTLSPLSSHPVKSATTVNTPSYQTSLLSVGMRIRKSIVDGYKRAPFTDISGNDQCKRCSDPASIQWKPMRQEETPLSSQESNVSSVSAASFPTSKASAKRRLDQEDGDTSCFDIDEEKENESSIAAWASIFARPKAKAVSRRKRWVGAREADVMDWTTENGEFEEANFLVP